MVDQFERAHTRGSSHGDGRIWRMAYEEDLYVDMMELSLKFWNELEAFESDRPPPYGFGEEDPRLITKTGM